VSEQILSSTSAQLDYTVSLTSVHAGKYRTEDKSKTDITKTEYNSESCTDMATVGVKGLTLHRRTRVLTLSFIPQLRLSSRIAE